MFAPQTLLFSKAVLGISNPRWSPKLDTLVNRTVNREPANWNRDATHDFEGESDKMLHSDTDSQRISWILWHSMRWCSWSSNKSEKCRVAVATELRIASQERTVLSKCKLGHSSL